MDLLYSRYASPNEFMNLYIEQGRFGEFVWNIVNLENTRRKEQAEAESDRMLWKMYIHSYADVCFDDWKSGLMERSGMPGNIQHSGDENLTEEQIQRIIEKAFSFGAEGD